MKSVPQRYERSSCDLHKLRLFIQWRTSPATSVTGSLTQKSQNPTQYMLVVLDRKNVLTLRHENVLLVTAYRLGFLVAVNL